MCLSFIRLGALVSRFISVENALQSWRAAGVEKLGRGAEEEAACEHALTAGLWKLRDLA